MPAVFVHGNPETPAVWDQLRSHLGREDVVALQLPGFGVPTPAGFAATKEDYLAWLAGELEQIEQIDGPLDLVGHDWGGAFVLRIACTRPELLRSWVSDVAGLLDPEYVWHPLAQVWQTPEAGEAFFTASLANSVDDSATAYEAIGIPAAEARAFAEAASEEMARCVLALYRSAAQPAMVEWGRDAPAAAARPGLVLAPGDDVFTGGTALSERMAKQLGATLVILEGRGHWWMLEDPQQGALVLERFWNGLGSA